MVEVSDSSLRKDRGKARLYAQAGVAEYWIINVDGRCAEVHRVPDGDIYRVTLIVKPGEPLESTAVPGVAVDLQALFAG